jgi:hypothetical protein
MLFVAHPTTVPATVPPRRVRRVLVIPVCNAVDYTRACLDELARRGAGLEVVVVDNGSSDGTRELLAGRPHVRTIRNEENRGFAGAVNQGLAAATAPLVCVLNNDTLLTDGWLEPLIARLEADPRVALAGPCTSYAKGASRSTSPAASGRCATSTTCASSRRAGASASAGGARTSRSSRASASSRAAPTCSRSADWRRSTGAARSRTTSSAAACAAPAAAS